MTSLGCFSAVVALSTALLVYGACTQERPACDPAVLAGIEAAYIAEAVQACQGQTFEGCTVLPAIRDKYRLQRAEWERCK